MSNDEYSFGPFRVDRVAMRLVRDGQEQPLRHQAVRLLCVLIEREGMAASFEDLGLWAWGQTHVEKNNVIVTAHEVRNALGRDYKHYIKTVRGGYLFRRPGRVYEAQGTTVGERHSVVLTTFEDAMAAKDNVHLAKGITSELLRTLSKIGRLRVVDATPQTVQLLPTGRTEETHLVEGSVAGTRDRPEVHVKLLNLPGREIVWSETYFTTIAGIQGLQSRIAVKIAEAIKLKLDAEDANKMRHEEEVDGATYELFLRGLNHWSRPSEVNLFRAIEYFRQATLRQPGYAKAFGAMAHAYGLLGFAGFMPPEHAMPQAESAARRCLEIFPDSPEGLAGLAAVEGYYLWRWKTAEEHLKRAIALNPNYETGHHLYAMGCLMPQLRLKEALREISTAQELNPLSPFVVTCVGIVKYYARDYRGAVEQFDRAIKMQPQAYLAHWHRGWALAELDRFDEAVAAIGGAVEMSQGAPAALAAFGQVLAAAGQVEESRRILGQLKEVAAERYVSPYDLALIYISLGDDAKAFALLRDAVDQRVPMLARLRVHPLFRRYRANSQYLELLRAVNLSPGKERKTETRPKSGRRASKTRKGNDVRGRKK